MYTSEIKTYVENCPQGEQWLEAFTLETQARGSVIAHDSRGQGLDLLKNPEHLSAQLAWAVASQDEDTARNELLGVVTSRKRQAIDLIARSALVASIQAYDTQTPPKASARLISGERIKSSGVPRILIPDLSLSQAKSRPRMAMNYKDFPDGLKGVDKVFYRADKIAETVCWFKETIQDGSVVEVRESQVIKVVHMNEKRRTETRGAVVTNVTKAVIESRAQSLQLRGPSKKGNSNTYNSGVPFYVCGAEIIESNRTTDVGTAYGGGAKPDRFTSLLKKTAEQPKIVDIPLPMLMYLCGQDVYDYLHRDRLSGGRTFSMTIDGQEVPMPSQK